MDGSILITYESRYGSTAEIAARIGKIVTEQGAKVDVMAIDAIASDAIASDAIASLDDYVAVVIGGPIYSGQWPQGLLDFIDKHENLLKEKPVACFVVAMRLREESEAMREAVLGTIDTQRILLDPVAIGLFAGVMDYSKLSAIVRLQMQTKNLPEGDFRDWDAIEAWARDLVPLLEVSIKSA